MRPVNIRFCRPVVVGYGLPGKDRPCEDPWGLCGTSGRRSIDAGFRPKGVGKFNQLANLILIAH